MIRHSLFGRCLVFCLAMLGATTAFADSQDHLAAARKSAIGARNFEIAANAALTSENQTTWATNFDESRRLTREAVRLYQQAGAGTTDDTNLLYEYVGVLERSKDFDLAIEVYRKLSQQAPEDPILYSRLGKTLMTFGEPRRLEAKEAFEQSLTIDQNSEAADVAAAGLGTIYWELGYFDLSESFYQKALVLDPEDLTVRISLAALYARRGVVQQAAKLLDSITSMRGDEVQLLRERLSKALADFDANRVWFPDTAQNHFAYGKLMLRLNRFPEALLVIERALDLDPENYVAWNIVASLTARNGDNESAKRAYQRSLAIKPNQPRTQSALDALN